MDTFYFYEAIDFFFKLAKSLLKPNLREASIINICVTHFSLDSNVEQFFFAVVDQLQGRYSMSICPNSRKEGTYFAAIVSIFFIGVSHARTLVTLVMR